MKKKIMTLLVAAVLVVSAIALVACSGGKVNVVDSQIKAITEVKAGQSDAAIIDSTMAGYLTREGSDFADLKMINSVEGFEFDKEYYAVAAKKGNAKLIAFVNAGIKAQQAEGGKYNKICDDFGLASRKVAVEGEFTVADDWKSELITAGEVTIGYTNNAPMGITNDDGTVTGFDIELAKAIFEPAGITVKTKLIDWGSKELELNGKKVDLVWNGLTRNEEREANMELSVSYLVNEQAIVVKADKVDSIKTVDDLKALKVAVEDGSAGADAANKMFK